MIHESNFDFHDWNFKKFEQNHKSEFSDVASAL